MLIDELIPDDHERHALQLQRERDAYRRTLEALRHCGSLADVQQIAAAVLERLPGEQPNPLRAVLEQLVSDPRAGLYCVRRDWGCLYCYAAPSSAWETVQHRDDCPIVRGRALLKGVDS